jgi:Na+/H+ antiporter NhaC
VEPEARREAVSTKRILIVGALVGMLAFAGELRQDEVTFELSSAEGVEGVPFVPYLDARYEHLVVTLSTGGEVLATFEGELSLRGFRGSDDAPLAKLAFEAGRATIEGAHLDGSPEIQWKGRWQPLASRTVAGWWSLAPPLVAIVLAILLREVLVALVSGILVGVVVLEGDLFRGFLRTLDRHLIGALEDTGRLKILVFSCLLGSVVALVARLGGVRAIVEAVARRGRSGRGAQLATWAMGILVFFDDYANALLVGNTMRPVTDRFRVSREKLSFLVDSTAAPVACIAIVTTWIASEISYIEAWLGARPEGVAGYAANGAYQMFLDSIPYSFYPILALAFGFMIVISRRDFGPMYRAEVRARETGKVLADGAMPLTSRDLEDATPVDVARLRWWNGALPILTVILGVVVGLHLDGKPAWEAECNALRAEAQEQYGILDRGGDVAPAELRRVSEALEDLEGGGFFGTLRHTFGRADSYNVLLWATVLGLLVAWALAVIQRMMTVRDLAHTTVNGIKAMTPALLVLVLAWTLSDLCKSMNTSGFLIQQVSFSFHLLPLVVFLLSAVVGFSTGSSWGTMGILVPLTLSYGYQLGTTSGAPTEALAGVLLGSLGGVLAGSVFGDHCSPISDTTVMSSMASGADHMDHVKTQLPYAVVVALVAALTGYLPAGYGWHPALSLIIGITILAVILRLVGKPVPGYTGADAS